MTAQAETPLLAPSWTRLLMRLHTRLQTDQAVYQEIFGLACEACEIPVPPGPFNATIDFVTGEVAFDTGGNHADR